MGLFQNPAERGSVFRLPVAEEAFTVVDEAGCRVKAAGRYVLYVGCSQPDARSAELTGAEPVKLEIEMK